MIINKLTFGVKRLIYRLLGKERFLSSDDYANWLRSRGCKIGNNFIAFSLSLLSDDIVIDFTRPELIEIGDNCAVNRGCRILTHDYVTGVFINKYSEFIPSSGKVKIGNNVHMGMEVTILKGVTVGDNVFIGAGALVTKDIPSNCIVAGRPAKVVKSLDEYFAQRKDESVVEALDYVKAIKERGRVPKTTDFYEEFPLFIDAENITDYPEMHQIIKHQLGYKYESWLECHKRTFDSFDAFIKAARK